MNNTYFVKLEFNRARQHALIVMMQKLWGLNWVKEKK